MTNVVLTNKLGEPTGSMEIIQAHTGEGALHQAFSVYVFRKNKSEILIQKRSNQKMLWPLFWANTCCSHPGEKEDIVQAAERRLQQECGFTCPLIVQTAFVYRAEDPEGRGVEHEYDSLLIGEVEGDIELHPDPSEVEELEWVTLEQLQADMKTHPERFAPWFHQGLPKVLA